MIPDISTGYIRLILPAHKMTIKVTWWPNRRGHKITSANNEKTGKIEDWIETLCRQICIKNFKDLYQIKNE